eukprot:CAMPEP_0183336936 /NCGR_PEP_ID=MMETSP0164_2-20130417/4767_1 /TAXON_ID=221442 /ORGANISM="Coccolithus pelagicus ssp braarudi, Strain PLY182g" /LENGTH=120 /DNA_ID=CAMNT_0025506557 /DNA_START=41 /DNA_END=403 /DNA_ORIENTATION=-
MTLSQVCSYTSAVFAVIAFSPQVVHTWRFRAAGSLSLLFFLVQSAGCYLVVFNAAFINHDPWPAWVPVGVGGTMQGIIFVLAAYHTVRDFRERTAKLDSGDSALLSDTQQGHAALLQPVK